MLVDGDANQERDEYSESERRTDLEREAGVGYCRRIAAALSPDIPRSLENHERKEMREIRTVMSCWAKISLTERLEFFPLLDWKAAKAMGWATSTRTPLRYCAFINRVIET